MKVINNTDQIKYLPIRNVKLEPGESTIDNKLIKINRGQPGFEQDIKSGRVALVKKQKKKEEFPKRTSKHSSWYLLSNGEKVQGEEEAMALQSELDVVNNE